MNSFLQTSAPAIKNIGPIDFMRLLDGYWGMLFVSGGTLEWEAGAVLQERMNRKSGDQSDV